MKANKFNILIVDDAMFNIDMVMAYLESEKYKIDYALGAQAALEIISKKNIDLILLDINMPKVNGFEVCKMLKSDTKTKDIPIVFLTANSDVDSISKAFEVGGVDYINKPFNPQELIARVKTHLQSRVYLREIKEKQSKLAQLSISDPLTKLYNTLFFEAQLKTKIAHNKKFWIFSAKINNFEKINGLYGFSKANMIIKKFAMLFDDACISKSIVARVYGVTFVAIIKDYDESSILEIERNFFKNIRNTKDFHKVINYNIAILHVTEPTTIDIIYKDLQKKLEEE